MLTSVSLVAAIDDERAPRGRRAAYSRRSHSIEPSAASASSSATASGAISVDVAVAGEQALDLLEPDLAAADDDAAAPGQLQAGDVERRVEHVAHARLVADPAAVLADAFLAGVGLCGIDLQGSLRPVPIGRHRAAYFTTTRCCAACSASGPSRWRAAGAAHAGRAPGRVRRASSRTPARWTSRTSGSSAPRRCWTRSAFGTREEADRATRRVRAMHRRVRGERRARRPLPGGHAVRADDPELLLWILATLVDSALLVYERYVAPLDARRARRVLAGLQGRSASCSGCATRDMPDTIEDFDAYMDGDARAAATCYVTTEARELAVRHRHAPAGPARARPVLELVNQITVGLLPREIRRGYGLRGTRRAPPRCTAARSTSSAWSSRSCPAAARHAAGAGCLVAGAGTVPTARAPRGPAGPRCGRAAPRPCAALRVARSRGRA